MKHTNYKLIILFAFIVLINLVTILPYPNNTRLFVVESSSMSPTIRKNSIVVTKRFISYQLGDVITFYDPNSEVSKLPTTTHRIEQIINKDGQTYYMTKGDNNNLSDEEFIPSERVVGKVTKIIPFLGIIIHIIKSPLGFLFLTLLPCLLIIKNELLNLYDFLTPHNTHSKK